jgi:hypothetical protein
MGVKVKKIIIAVLAAAFVFAACDNPTVDFSLPETDTSFFISGSTVTFPKGTKAIDVYNTVVFIYSDNEYHDITNGGWQYITTTNTNGLINQTWETVNFGRVRNSLAKYKTHPNNSGDVHTHSVFLYTDESNIKEIVYQWEAFNGSTQKMELKNESIEGEITFTF